MAQEELRATITPRFFFFISYTRDKSNYNFSSTENFYRNLYLHILFPTISRGKGTAIVALLNINLTDILDFFNNWMLYVVKFTTGLVSVSLPWFWLYTKHALRQFASTEKPRRYKLRFKTTNVKMSFDGIKIYGNTYPKILCGCAKILRLIKYVWNKAIGTGRGCLW